MGSNTTASSNQWPRQRARAIKEPRVTASGMVMDRVIRATCRLNQSASSSQLLMS